MPQIPKADENGVTELQVWQRMFFRYIDGAAEMLDPDELDALRQSVVMRIDRVADTALGEF